MTTDTIFSTPEDKQGVTPPTTTEEKGLLAALVGENQKYKSVEDLAKAYVNADEFLAQLKEENRTLREKQAAAATLDDVMNRINKPVEEGEQRPAQPSEQDIAALVERTVTGMETKRSREANLRKADSLMKEMFGDKAEQVFKKAATSPEQVKVYMDLASVSPEQFVKLFAGEKQPEAPRTLDMGSYNASAAPSAVSDRSNVEGTKEWSTKIRKENPKLYYSSEFQHKLQQLVTKNPTLYFGKQGE